MRIGRFFCAVVIGALGIACLLLAAAPAGAETLQWMRTYNGPANLNDSGNGVAVAPDGSVYVTGYTYVSGQQWYDLLLRKYSANGALVWMKTYNGPANGWDFGNGVAVVHGSVYVTGYTDVAGQVLSLTINPRLIPT